MHYSDKWHNFCHGLISGEQTQIIRNYGFIPDQIFNARNIENNNDQQNSLNSLLQHSEPQSSSSLSTISDLITRLFSSMFIHASIAHIGFNLFALMILVYTRKGGWSSAIYIDIHHIRNCRGSISWCYCFLYFAQWKCSIDRCVRSNLWCIRDSWGYR